MKNIEKYEEEIRNGFIEQTAIGCATKKSREGNCNDETDCNTCCLKSFNWLLKEYKEPIKPILTEKEKIIIEDIIKAVKHFGAEVQRIAKYRQGDEPTDYYLNFSYKNSTDDFDTFTFNGNELFVGMKVDELYTLEELGL